MVKVSSFFSSLILYESISIAVSAKSRLRRGSSSQLLSLDIKHRVLPEVTSTKNAVRAIQEFSERTGALKFVVSRSDMAARLTELFNDPDSVNQSSLSACGPAAILRCVLHRDPKLVVDFGIDLVEKGKGEWGSRTVEPCKDLRNQSYDKLFRDYNYKGLWCPVADWVMLSSLRDDENFWFDYEGTPDDKFSGITSAGEMEEWLEDTGLYESISDETNMYFTKNKKHLSGLTVDNETDNILLINAHIMKQVFRVGGDGDPKKTPKKSDDIFLSAFPNHYVVLLKKPVIDQKNVKLSVWSWGGTYDLNVPITTFESNYYGAVIGKAK